MLLFLYECVYSQHFFKFFSKFNKVCLKIFFETIFFKMPEEAFCDMKSIFVGLADGGALGDHGRQCAGVLHRDSGLQRHLYQLQPSLRPLLDHAQTNGRSHVLPRLHFNNCCCFIAKVTKVQHYHYVCIIASYQ